jgi:hypothetical protein
MIGAISCLSTIEHIKCAMPKRFSKQPAENLDYEFDWIDWMPEGDSIVSFTVSVSPSGLILGNQSNTPTSVRQFVSSGMDGTDYTITCRITTNQGRIDEEEITLLVREVS